MTAEFTAADLVTRLSAAGVPASVVRPVTALAGDPQLEALGLWATTADGLTLPKIPIDAVTTSIGPVPRLGQHTIQALTAAGMTDPHIARLVADGTLVTG